MISKFDSRKQFVSIRLKLLIGFTVLFSAVFAAAFYWFYYFLTEKTMTRLFQDMEDTALGTAQDIDVESLMALYETGIPDENPPDGDSNRPIDIRYDEQLEWFHTINEIEPRAWPYTFVVVDAPLVESEDEEGVLRGSILSSFPRTALVDPTSYDLNDIPTIEANRDYATVFLADLWVDFDNSKAAQFLEVSTVSQETLTALHLGEPVSRELYDDGQWGSWISIYVPLKNEAGESVALLGIDFEASYVREVQGAVRDRVFVAFGITYFTLFVLVSLLANIFSKPVVGLTQVAEQIGEGNYDHDYDSFVHRRLPDETTKLAEVFALMVSKVRKREEKLKQQVADLKIEIDEKKRQKQVSEIVDSDFFQDLQLKARSLRNRSRNSSLSPTSSPQTATESAPEEKKEATKGSLSNGTPANDPPETNAETNKSWSDSPSAQTAENATDHLAELNDPSSSG